MLAVTFYSVVVAVHVMAIVIAFGVTFAYPILGPYIGRNHPGSLRALHEAQERIGKFLITPFATLALITGIYLAGDHDLFGKIWVQVPMGILIVLLGVGGAFFAPSEKKAAALAPVDGQPPSPEYLAINMRVAKVGGVANLLVLVAIFMMVAKPGGY
jgi:uncharacterized membrane protein